MQETVASGRARPSALSAFLALTRAAAAVALAVCAGCAAPGSDVHLEPLWSGYTNPDGARETEALFGAYQHRRGGIGRAVESTTLGPLWSLDRYPEGEWRSRFVLPLGYARHRGGDTSCLFVPVFAWRRSYDDEGNCRWSWVGLPGWVFHHEEERGTQFAWFPFFADLHDFLIWDRVRFLLWPLAMRLEKPNGTTDNVLFPFFAWGYGEKRGWRVWPLAGHWNYPGHYRRSFFLWPFFHWQHNRLAGGGMEPQWMWFFFPLVGRSRVGTQIAWTWLWPFFGYTRDPETEFWSLDCPWPLVRLQRSEEVHRTRFWPFYSRLEADDLVATNFLWPLGHLREERYLHSERDSTWFLPFWRSWRRLDRETGIVSSWHKLWPIFQNERAGNWNRGSFPALSPFHRGKIEDRGLGIVDRHFGWAWRLWEWERAGGMRTERSWAGLLRHRANEAEERSSFSGLWARRRYDGPRGRTRETSLLFGLLRWRVTEEGGFDMLPMAFPGPGWPADWTPAPDRSPPAATTSR